MNAFSPLAFAKIAATKTANGILFIQTANGGNTSRYGAELGELGKDIVEILAENDVAFVTDLSALDVAARLENIVQFYNDGSCLSFAALFINPIGNIARVWNGGQDGDHLAECLHGEKMPVLTQPVFTNKVAARPGR